MTNYVFEEKISEKPIISSQSGAPVTTPVKIGDLNVDITEPALYVAKGNSSALDWFKVASSGGGFNFEDTATTNDATPTEMTQDVDLVSGDVVFIESVFVAKNEDGSVSFVSKVRAGYYYEATSAVLLGSIVDEIFTNDTTAIDASFSISSASIKNYITGKAATTLHWKVRTTYVILNYTT